MRIKANHNLATGKVTYFFNGVWFDTWQEAYEAFKQYEATK